MTLSEGWQRVVERYWSGVERITHTRDRRRAAARIRRRGWPRHVVVVCYGNICRSPYAAAYLRRRLTAIGQRTIVVESAGFIGPDRPANRQGAAIAMDRGIDLSGHRSRLIGRMEVEKADLVLVMTRSQRGLLIERFGIPDEGVELLGDFDHEDPPYRNILDPYGKTDDEFRRVFTQIERSVDGFVADLTT